MAALTETYVDPAIAGDSGAGTIGDPYGDLQYALNTMTRDSTNGDRINIKAGTAEVLTAALSFTTYGTPNPATAPLVLQGYTSAAGDGGMGAIDGDGAYGVIFIAPDGTNFINLDMGNCGATTIIYAPQNAVIQGCVIHGGVDGIFAGGSHATIIGNHLYDITRYPISSGPSLVAFNYIEGSAAIGITYGSGSRPAFIAHNIVTGAYTASAIKVSSEFGHVMNNSVLVSAGGTGKGIDIAGGAPRVSVMNNLVEGMSGSGGVGIAVTSANGILTIGGNGVYNCATAFNLGSDIVLEMPEAANETLGASPFDKSGSNTFANRAVYFAPVDTGSVRGGAYPTALRLDKGAVQHADPSGGGGGRRPRLVTVS